MQNKLLKIGITGGIGTGKTEVCKILEKEGEKILYADLIAREITEKNDKVKEKIKSVFGKQVFDKEGSLIRKKLGDIVFKDKSLKEKLNRIIHPEVFKKIDLEIASLGQERKLIFIEAAIIFETRMYKDLDYILVVDTDNDIRIKRIMERDGIDIKKIKNIFKSQMSQEEKVKKADFVIKNNSSLSDLKERTLFIRNLLLMMKKPE